MDKITIDFNKKLNGLFREARQMGKPTHCFLCGKQINGACNSHSIPQFVLKKLESNSYLISATAAAETFGFLVPKKGLNNCGTFHNICNDCDQKVFQDYENESLLSKLSFNDPCPDKLLAEIRLKTALLELDKKTFSKNTGYITNKLICDELPKISPTTNELDISDYAETISECRSIISSNSKGNFYVNYINYLPYNSQFVGQPLIVLQQALDETIINDVFNMNKDYKIAGLQMVIFPLGEKTLLMSFCFSKDKERLMTFFKYFDSINKVSKIKLFQAILFAYTEEIYTTPKMIEIMKEQPKIQEFISDGIFGGLNFPSQNEIIKPNGVSLHGFRKMPLLL